MAAIAEFKRAFVADVRLAIAVKPRGFGEGAKHIQLRERVTRCVGFAASCREHLFAHVKEKFVFQFHTALFRAENFAFHFLQFRSDESFAVGDGLFADVIRRNFIEVRLVISM